MLIKKRYKKVILPYIYSMMKSDIPSSLHRIGKNHQSNGPIMQIIIHSFIFGILLLSDYTLLTTFSRRCEFTKIQMPDECQVDVSYNLTFVRHPSLYSYTGTINIFDGDDNIQEEFIVFRNDSTTQDAVKEMCLPLFALNMASLCPWLWLNRARGCGFTVPVMVASLCP